MMKSPLSLTKLAIAVLRYVSNGVAGKHLKGCAKKKKKKEKSEPQKTSVIKEGPC